MSSQVTFPPAAPAAQGLARTVMSRVDRDANGQISYDEFSAFLESVLRQVAGSQGPSFGSRAAAATAAAPTTDPLPPVMPGWDAAKWVDASHTTVKYVAGRVMARYRPSDWLDAGKRERILEAFRAAGLNPTAVGTDKVDFNDGYGAVDIVQAAGEGGRAWQWLPAA